MNKITVWSNDLKVSEKLLDEFHNGKMWRIKEGIRRKFNWSRFTFEYRFIAFKD